MQLQSRKEVLKMRNTALRFLTKFALVSLLMLPFVVSAEAHGHFGGGGRAIIVPHYSYYHPYWGYGGWGWANPYWGYGPYYYEDKGTIKIKDHDKSDQVYINGAFAGIAEKMKNIKLDPGQYTIQIRRQGNELLNRSVYVIAGKTVEIDVGGN